MHCECSYVHVHVHVNVHVATFLYTFMWMCMHVCVWLSLMNWASCLDPHTGHARTPTPMPLVNVHVNTLLCMWTHYYACECACALWMCMFIIHVNVHVNTLLFLWMFVNSSYDRECTVRACMHWCENKESNICNVDTSEIKKAVNWKAKIENSMLGNREIGKRN